MQDLHATDTICAIATAPGNGAIAVIRLSGKQAITICDMVFESPTGTKKLSTQKANTIHFGQLKDGEAIIDEVLVSIFKAPYSYTGENIVEVSCHGSTYIQQRILQLFTKNGARLAKPGEFTMRAYLNGKMDLSQAEAVADLIASSNETSHRVAIQQMRGGFSHEIAHLRDRLLHFISYLELELDFSEEDVEFADRKQLIELLEYIQKVIARLINSFELGNVIKNGVPVAIVGEPNVGKSTLLNALLNEDRAIVSDIAGTTRDTIEDTLVIKGVSFRFIDTAGIRNTSDTVEGMGIERTFAKVAQSALVLLLVDAVDSYESISERMQEIKKRMPEGAQLIIVVNKVDRITNYEEVLAQKFKPLRSGNDAIIAISAKNNLYIDKLIEVLLQSIRYDILQENDLIVTNARHLDGFSKANDALTRALDGVKSGLSGDLLAMDVRQVIHYLGEITGNTITTDEILGNIFKNFCIGK